MAAPARRAWAGPMLMRAHSDPAGRLLSDITRRELEEEGTEWAASACHGGGACGDRAGWTRPALPFHGGRIRI